MTGTVLCPRCSRLPRPTVNCSKCKQWRQRAEDAVKRQPELPKMKEYEDHPFAAAFPLMTNDELNELAADIGANGLVNKIWLYEGKVLDGRNRYRACKIADYDPQFEEYKDKTPKAFVWSQNGPRRHLSQSQKAMAAASLLDTEHGGDRRSDQAATLPLETQESIANAAGIGERTIRDAKKVLDEGSKALIDAVKSGDVPVHTAATITDLPKKEQAAAVKSGTVPEVAKKVRAKRKKKAKPEPARPDQPSLPKTGRKQPHVEPTKKGRPTEFGMLADLETTERCVKELQQVRASLDFLARHGNGVSEIAKNVFGTDDPDGIYILHEMKRPDPANHNMITPFMTCEALEGFLTRMFLIGHEIIRLHGADEVVDRGETITF